MSCTASSQCNDTELLSCITNRCLCSSFQYWNTSYALCVNIQTINLPCSQDYQCDYRASLYCINNICDCDTTYYWNNTYCNPKLTNNALCTSSYQCQSWYVYVCFLLNEFLLFTYITGMAYIAIRVYVSVSIQIVSNYIMNN